MANKLIFLKAPPEIISIKPKMFCVNNESKTAGLIPGAGMCAPSRKMRNITNVNSSFPRRKHSNGSTLKLANWHLEEEK